MRRLIQRLKHFAPCNWQQLAKLSFVIRLLLALIFLSATSLSLQSQIDNHWEFYFAFEDATGARDTIYLFWSDEATNFIDPQFGEELVDLNDNGEMQAVFTQVSFAWEEGYYKTIAAPLNFEGIDGIIGLINYTEPVELECNGEFFTDNQQFPVLDSLFISGELHNDYFFFGPESDFPCECYNLNLNNGLVLPENWPVEHFPIFWTFNHSTILSNNSTKIEDRIKLYPNPVEDFLYISSDSQAISNCEIFNCNSTEVLHLDLGLSETDKLNLEHLDAGIYFLKIGLGDGSFVIKKIAVN